jgi:hypothetical protein
MAEAELHCQMTTCEQFALQHVVRDASPDVAIEIGTYQGGSLQVLSSFAKDVATLDIDPTVPERLSSVFPRVRFCTGNSSEVLGELLDEYAASGRFVGFILIDGDHSAEGVGRDIRAILRWRPNGPCVVLMHDSFNPGCRAGILAAPWESSPFVQEVEVDFVPGIFHEDAYDTADARTMWGGFARALLTPMERRGPLHVTTSQQGLFNAVYRASSHRATGRLSRRILRYVARRAGLRQR